MSKKVMAINCGSSSLKFKLYEMPTETVMVEGAIEQVGKDDAIFSYDYQGKKHEMVQPVADHDVAVHLVLDTLLAEHVIANYNEIAGVGHRISNGGRYYSDATLIDADVEKRIDQLSVLSPLHNPVNLIGIKAVTASLPDAKEVAVFDTAYHHTMPVVDKIYGIPYKYYEKDGIRRYGFHGPSHQYIALKTAELFPNNSQRIISCHIGNGASITAIKDGKSVVNSMGFTPLAGLVMGTRSGDVDPQIIPYLEQQEGMSAQDVKDMLNKKSGLLGLSGISNDVRDLAKIAGDQSDERHERADLALKVFAHQIQFYIGAYAAELNGVDSIVFTAGVGEHSALVRQLACQNLGYLGVKIDTAKNAANALSIETADSTTKVLVIPTDEELMIARDVVRVAQL
ncbi:acetate/propionate family kinase [Loigolactobacillus coryniformis]|uniref:Acetate kinase n=1 Tax=Loigolactobacillus coryniformis subsp. torquens DSM 20004 = KCTC 3535 TaxID=1423822 RepID=A0A2D1KM09_9LACO|nr:acetate kinase [Loigolactobacillus coryniformis]ATO43131.1 acetate kinase [Loigolactobacillus coryniformis subsp. torquens DSM 20004 = KCTC 3535]KRK84473.1 acetate kinase [Loigolactobacillus coryniformis subsp. torquens DSM 20004 = KCTC 3535]